MTTKARSKPDKKSAAKPLAKVKDLKPKKDPKGGPWGSEGTGGSTRLNHNETIVRDATL